MIQETKLSTKSPLSRGVAVGRGVLKPFFFILTIFLWGALFAQRPIEASGVTSKTKDGNTNAQLTLTDITSGQDDQTHTFRTNALDAGPTLTIGTNSAYNHTLSVANAGAGDFNMNVSGTLAATNINSSGTITVGTLSGGTGTKLAGLTAGNVVRDITVGSGLSLTSGTLSASGGLPTGTNNNLLTSDGSGGAVSETNLNFDGSVLQLSTGVKIASGHITSGSDAASTIYNGGGSSGVDHGASIRLYGASSVTTPSSIEINFANTQSYPGASAGSVTFKGGGSGGSNPLLAELDSDGNWDYQDNNLTTTGDITAGNLVGSTFTPTLTLINDGSEPDITSATANQTFYKRTGDVVEALFSVEITYASDCGNPAGPGETECCSLSDNCELELSLPVASNLVDLDDYVGAIIDTTNDRVEITDLLTGQESQTTTHRVYLTYIIK